MQKCENLRIFWFLLIFSTCVGIEAQVPTGNWFDYLEFYSSLRYCKDMVQEKENYRDCVNRLVNLNELRLQGDVFVQLCGNRQQYLNCWKPIVEKSKVCNVGSERGVPSVYKASLEAICSNDYGRANKVKLERAFLQQNSTTTPRCSNSQEHWIDACTKLEENMSSNHSCTRYRALAHCLDIIVCKEKPVEKLYLDLYKQAGRRLACST